MYYASLWTTCFKPWSQTQTSNADAHPMLSADGRWLSEPGWAEAAAEDIHCRTEQSPNPHPTSSAHAWDSTWRVRRQTERRQQLTGERTSACRPDCSDTAGPPGATGTRPGSAARLTGSQPPAAWLGTSERCPPWPRPRLPSSCACRRTPATPRAKCSCGRRRGPRECGSGWCQLHSDPPLWSEKFRMNCWWPRQSLISDNRRSCFYFLVSLFFLINSYMTQRSL